MAAWWARADAGDLNWAILIALAAGFLSIAVTVMTVFDFTRVDDARALPPKGPSPPVALSRRRTVAKRGTRE